MGFRNKHGNRVAKSSVEYILHNIAYTGKFEYNDVIIENTDIVFLTLLKSIFEMFNSRVWLCV